MRNKCRQIIDFMKQLMLNVSEITDDGINKNLG